MTIVSNGFTLVCDNTGVAGTGHAGEYGKYHLEGVTRRGIITRARRAGWFVGSVRVISGQPKSKVRTRRLTLCHVCKWLVMR